MICFEFSYTGSLTFREIWRDSRGLIGNMSSGDSLGDYSTSGVESNGSLRAFSFQ